MESFNYFLKSETLINYLTKLKNNGLKQAYLFSSVDKQKNYASCKILSLLINCKNNLDLTCDNCKKILDNNCVDLLNYPKNKAIVVEDIEEIINSAYILPLENEYKIYILNDFDEANLTSQNKFLKTLEEPPKNVIFMLNSTKTEMVLDTIKSRCEKIILPSLEKTEIEKILTANNVDLDNTVLDNSNGELGVYLQLSNTNFAKTFDYCINLLLNMKSSSDLLEYSTKIIKDKNNLENYFISLLSIFNDILVVKYDETKINNISNIDKIKTLSNSFSEKAVNEIIKNLIQSNKELSFNTNENLVIDTVLINILEEKHKWN